MLGSRGPICSALEKMPSSTAAVVGVAALFGAAAAFTCGLYYGSTGKTKTRSKPRSLDLGASPEANYKMVLCVRMDLKMGKGKIAAQCGHAKVTLQVKDEEAMLDLYQRAKKIGVPTYIVVDAGRTQIAPNSRTVMSVGPAPEDSVNQ